MTRNERLQKVALWVAVTSAALGFVTSAGCQVLPPAPVGFVWVLHPFLLLLGAAAAWLAVVRSTEIDRQRWQIAEDPSLTSGERDYAHRHAERLHRWASTSFVLAPLMLGYWMAYQIEGEGRRLSAQLLPVTAVVGSLLGMISKRLRERWRGDRTRT